MIRSSLKEERELSCIPRESGDDPVASQYLEAGRMYSPRERG